MSKLALAAIIVSIMLVVTIVIISLVVFLGNDGKSDLSAKIEKTKRQQGNIFVTNAKRLDAYLSLKQNIPISDSKDLEEALGYDRTMNVTQPLWNTLLLQDKSLQIYNVEFTQTLQELANEDRLNDDHIFQVNCGDGQASEPSKIFIKTRNIKDEGYGTVVKMEWKRHFGNVYNIDQYDVPWSLKKYGAVFRGVDTGFNDDHTHGRLGLILQYYNKYPTINVGFNDIVQRNPTSQDWALYDNHRRDSLSFTEQLTYKYIISVEGNDVASGLKWQLASNSIVIMTRPTKMSWFCEHLLQPWVHYIPVNDDYSNLIDQMEKAEALGPGGLKHINDAAKYFAYVFLDQENEEKILKQVITGNLGI